MSRDGADVPPDRQPALQALSLLSGKWHPTVLIVVARTGPIGFNELLSRVPDVSGKVLSETLDALGDAGLIRRQVVSESPLRVEYAATEAGRDMDAVFDALADWGRQHLETAVPTVLLADGDRRIIEMYAGWIRDRYTVVRVHTTNELADQLRTDPDVVVLDEGLPGGDLHSLHRTVGSAPRTITLIGDRPTVDLLDAGGDDVLRKPVVRSTLLETIEAQLERQGESPVRRERAAMEARLALLESIHPTGRLEASEVYLDARERVAELDSLLADD